MTTANRTGSARRNVVWGMSTLSAFVLVFSYHTSTSSAEATGTVGTTGTTTTGSSGTSTGASAAAGSSVAASGAASSSASSATSTTVTGEAADTRWGPVQVQLTVSGGKVTAVDVVQQPDQNGRDQEINARALPILVQETLSAQSSKIDMVSGATYTSTGYITSLQIALDQAGL